MTNNEKVKEYIYKNFGDNVLILRNNAFALDASSNACAMFFIQRTQTLKNELFYVINKNEYYPKGLISKNDLLKKLVEHAKINNLEKMSHNPNMNRIGYYMGKTHCRCCNKTLGNGNGNISYKDDKDNNIVLQLSGDADHYVEHGIYYNLITYLFQDKERNVKVQVHMVGHVKEIQMIKEYINSLPLELKKSLSKQSEENLVEKDVIEKKKKIKF